MRLSQSSQSTQSFRKTNCFSAVSAPLRDMIYPVVLILILLLEKARTSANKKRADGSSALSDPDMNSYLRAFTGSYVQNGSAAR
jgi:hypothetical protein